jgi:hypothetical protein
MSARLRLSWGMKTLKLFLLPVLDSLEFGWQVIRYALIFVSAFFRQRASLGCEMVAMRSQLTFYKESIRQKRQPRPRFHPALHLLWVLLSSMDRMEVCGRAEPGHPASNSPQEREQAFLAESEARQQSS